MKSNKTIYISAALLLSVVILSCGEASAQMYPERRHIRAGNKGYAAQDYSGAEERYRTALEKVPLSYEAAFNLSDALYRQQKYDEAAGILKNLSQNAQLSPERRAKVFYNLGNTMFQQQKLEEARDLYKEALRNDPADMDAKYNLAYVQKLLEQQENNQNKDNNDQNDKDDKSNSGDNKQDKNDGQDQNKNGQNGDDADNNRQDDPDKGSDQQQNGQNDDRNDQSEKPQPQNGDREGRISRESAESMLNAIQQQEDNTREKVNQQRAVSVGRSGKNW